MTIARSAGRRFNEIFPGIATLDPREVLVRREGRRVILEPADEWSEEFRSCLGSWSGDIPRPKQQKITELRNPFA